MKLKPKNWATFQHYKDRCPPWIKLHRDILNDRVFMGLPTASKALAPMLWLLASESRDGDGSFDGSIEELEFRLRIPAAEIQIGLKALIAKGFFVDASTMLAPCLQDAIPEGERERETEKEREAEIAPKGDLLADIDPQVAKDFKALRSKLRAAITKTAIEGIQREADKAGIGLEAALRVCCERGWRGFKADWITPPQAVKSNLGMAGQSTALAAQKFLENLNHE